MIRRKHIARSVILPSGRTAIGPGAGDLIKHFALNGRNETGHCRRYRRTENFTAGVGDFKTENRHPRRQTSHYPAELKRRNQAKSVTRQRTRRAADLIASQSVQRPRSETSMNSVHNNECGQAFKSLQQIHSWPVALGNCQCRRRECGQTGRAAQLPGCNPAQPVIPVRGTHTDNVYPDICGDVHCVDATRPVPFSSALHAGRENALRRKCMDRSCG